MEDITLKAIDELRNFMKAFKGTLDSQKYEVNVFDHLNKRYIAASKIINEYEKAQENNTSNCAACGSDDLFKFNLTHVKCRKCEVKYVCSY